MKTFQQAFKLYYDKKTFVYVASAMSFSFIEFIALTQRLA